MLVNPKTQHLLDSFVSEPSHALLLVGTLHTGTDVLVNQVAQQLHTKYNSVHRQILPKGGTISIDDIRELRAQERLKTSATHQSIASIVSIVPVDAMQPEAQNALLKLLEEPPKGTLFIVVCHDESMILPTIASRCKRVDVLPVSQDQVTNTYGTQKNVLQAYYISSGEALLLDAVINDIDHPLLQSIIEAKALLSAPLVDRLQIVDSIVKEKRVDQFLDALSRICRAALQTASTNKQQVWAHNLQLVLQANVYIQAHVQPKLVLSNLFSHLQS